MRTRLVGMAAALVLVAAGVAIGAGPLQGDSGRNHREAVKQQAALADRDAEIEHLTAATALGSAYTGATAARVLAGRLTSRAVAIITVPGSDPDTVAQLTGLVRAAGARVTAQIALTAAVLDPGSQGLVEALSSQMVGQSPGVVPAAGANGFGRIGALLARAIGVPPSTHTVSAPYDPTAISIVSGFQAAELIGTATVTARAGLALVVLPASTDRAAVTPLTDVLAGLDASIPTVVTGPAAAAADGQVLAALRGDTGSRASTVDSADLSVGRTIAVLALVAQTRGVVGDYGGIAPVDAAIPPGS